MNTEDILKNFEKQKNTGIILIIVGIIVVIVGFLRFFFPYGIAVGIILFSVGLGFVIHSRKTIEQLPVESQTELYAKKSTYFYFKRKLKFGIIYFGIGIVLIIIGVILWYVSMYLFFAAIMLWVIGGILFIAGVGLLIRSASIRRNMNKLEES